MSTTAKLFVDPQPEMGPETKRYTIDCKFSTTRLWFSPGPIDFPEPHRISIVLQKHEDECGRCNLVRLWREHGSPEMKAEVDRLYGEIQERQVARHLAEPEELMPELMMEFEEGSEIVELLLGAGVVGFLFQRFFRRHG